MKTVDEVVREFPGIFIVQDFRKLDKEDGRVKTKYFLLDGFFNDNPTINDIRAELDCFPIKIFFKVKGSLVSGEFHETEEQEKAKEFFKL